MKRCTDCNGEVRTTDPRCAECRNGHGSVAFLGTLERVGLVWKPRKPCEAFCAEDETKFPHRPKVHTVPDASCKCGIWAVYYPMLLTEVEWSWDAEEVLIVGQVAE